MAAAPAAHGGAGEGEGRTLKKGAGAGRCAGALLWCEPEVVRAMSILVGPALHPAHRIPDLKSCSRDSVLGELARQAQGIGATREPGMLRSALLMRERLGPTAAGHGFAVPNARSLLVTRPVLLVARSRSGVDWGAEDGAAVRLVILVISPAEMSAPCHVAAVARVVAAAHPARARQRLFASDSPGEIADLLGVSPG
jgi:mannitol/fructose-specific phosphotransferase system IIA component (Ntr-type)